MLKLLCLYITIALALMFAGLITDLLWAAQPLPSLLPNARTDL